MGSTELAANMFRATQTEEKLRREQVKGIQAANLTHFKVGTKVRQTIKELGGPCLKIYQLPLKAYENWNGKGKGSKTRFLR